MGSGTGETVSPRAWRIPLFLHLVVTVKMFKSVYNTGLATGQTPGLVLETGPGNPLWGGLQGPGGGGWAGRQVGGMDSARLHTQKEDFSYINHCCGCMTPVCQPSLCRREHSGPVFQKVQLGRVVGTVIALTLSPGKGERGLILQTQLVPHDPCTHSPITPECC